MTIDFTDVPFSVTEFYELLDFPSYLAERAAGDAEANAPDPFRIDMLTLHSSATQALTHFFKGKEGDSLDGYVRTANTCCSIPNGQWNESKRSTSIRSKRRAVGIRRGSMESGLSPGSRMSVRRYRRRASSSRSVRRCYVSGSRETNGEMAV
jgi:hypothetical protein